MQRRLKMNYYDEIKKELIDNEINRKVKSYSINKSDLNTYYNVGKMLSEAGKHYGENIIGDYANKLRIELNKKYNARTLRRYRQFYKFVTNLKWSAMPTKLSWSHITELMTLSDEDEINYYISLVNDRNISYRKLSELIKDNEYSRIDENTKNKLKQKENLTVKDLIKSPIVIRNNNNYEIISEKVLQKLILEDIETFMKELGNSFCFIGSQYKIKIGNRNNYIDLLLFNIKYNCYVIVELKVTEFKVEYIAQVQKYMNYIDKNIKGATNDNTIGILICKKENKFVIEYCSDDRIAVREYELV